MFMIFNVILSHYEAAVLHIELAFHITVSLNVLYCFNASTICRAQTSFHRYMLQKWKRVGPVTPTLLQANGNIAFYFTAVATVHSTLLISESPTWEHN